MSSATASVSIKECIGRCQSCTQECLRCINHCLSKGGDHAAFEHQSVMHDCAEICTTAANYLSRGSANAEQVCMVCAQVCHLCAISCNQMSDDDEQMDACARACTKCEEACREIANSDELH